MSDLRLRRADSSDVQAVRHVARESWSDAYDGVIPAHIQQQAIAAWYSPEALVRSFTSALSVFLIAEREGAMIGFIHVVLPNTGPRVAELTRIYVLPTAQRTGAGSALLSEALAIARDRGAVGILVAVARRNHKGREFYERGGFQRQGTRTVDLFGHLVEEVTYSLTI